MVVPNCVNMCVDMCAFYMYVCLDIGRYYVDGHIYAGVRVANVEPRVVIVVSARTHYIAKLRHLSETRFYLCVFIVYGFVLLERSRDRSLVKIHCLHVYLPSKSTKFDRNVSSILFVVTLNAGKKN